MGGDNFNKTNGELTIAERVELERQKIENDRNNSILTLFSTMSKRITEAVNDGYNDAYAYLMVNNNEYDIDELIQKIRDESNNQGINVEFIHTEGINSEEYGHKIGLGEWYLYDYELDLWSSEQWYNGSPQEFKLQPGKFEYTMGHIDSVIQINLTKNDYVFDKDLIYKCEFIGVDYAEDIEEKDDEYIESFERFIGDWDIPILILKINNSYFCLGNLDIEDEDYGWHVKSASTNYNGGHRKKHPFVNVRNALFYDLTSPYPYQFKNGESLVSGFELYNYGKQFWKFDYGILVRFLF